MCAVRKPLIWLKGEVKSPPFSKEARLEAGQLLGRLQEGALIGMPHSRPMPGIGPGCHELRIKDEKHEWRIFYLSFRVTKNAKNAIRVPDRATTFLNAKFGMN